MSDILRSEAIEIFKNMLDAWDNYYTIASSDKKKEAVKLAISSLETDESYQLEYEISTGQTKVVTTKQLEEMYQQFERKLWSVHEDVRGDDMVEIGYAEQFLQDFLMEMGCWDETIQEHDNIP